MAPYEKKILKTWATIQKQKTKRGSNKNVFIGAMSADVVILAAGVVLSGDRQWEEKKKEKTQFIVFCKCYKTPNGSKKKKENKRVGFNTPVLLEAPARQFIGGLVGIYIYQWEAVRMIGSIARSLAPPGGR